MSDFFLDLRPHNERRSELAADRLKYFPDITTSIVEHRSFSAVIARDDNPAICAPFRSEGDAVTVMLCGRVAFEAADWQAARSVAGTGGLACKRVFQKYCENGIAGLKELNGNFTLILHDAREAAQEKLFIVTDRAGYAPAFQADDPLRSPVFSSNTDLLAAAIGCWDDLDVTSLAEFVATGRLSFPFTYYRKIKSLDFGAITTIELGPNGPTKVSSARYHEFAYRGREDDSGFDELASGLADAFRNAVRRRTQPEMGRSMVSLSGGLDSRTVLSACPPGTASFSFLDEENYESRIAGKIAATLGSEHLWLRRHAEYYSEVSPLGLRLNAGMGRFIVNTYLGFREQLRGAGMENLLSGCYCDYFFKGLLVNKRVHRWRRTEYFTSYAPAWYIQFFKLDSGEMPAVAERIDAIVPERLRNKTDNASVFEVEARRVLPLFYETDSRGVAQRVISWSAVTADNDILNMFERIPHRMKLDTKVFLEAVRKVCPKEVLRIPDANTGTPLTAGEFRRFFGRWQRAIAFLAQKKFAPKVATTGSWPDWGYYISHSEKLYELWIRKNPLASEVLSRVMGYDPFERPLRWWVDRGEMEVILRLITLKIWLDVRIRGQNDPGAH